MKEFIRVQDCVFAVGAIIWMMQHERSVIIRTTHGERTFWYKSQAKAQEEFESLWNYFAD